MLFMRRNVLHIFIYVIEKFQLLEKETAWVLGFSEKRKSLSVYVMKSVATKGEKADFFRF